MAENSKELSRAVSSMQDIIARLRCATITFQSSPLDQDEDASNALLVVDGCLNDLVRLRDDLDQAAAMRA